MNRLCLQILLVVAGTIFESHHGICQKREKVKIKFTGGLYDTSYDLSDKIVDMETRFNLFMAAAESGRAARITGDFTGSSPFFNSEAQFSSIIFDGKVEIGGGVFFKRAVFNWPVFRQDVSFVGCEFKDKLEFADAEFHSLASFRDISVAGYAHCYNSFFLKGVDFGAAKFNRYFELYSTFIQGRANFSSAYFGNLVSFWGTKFTSSLDFTSTSLGDSAFFTFQKSILPDTIRISELFKIPNEIDLTQADYTHDLKKHLIFLNRMDFSKIRMDYRFFKLLFTNSSGVEITNDEKEAVYEGLLKNFKDKGQTESYKLLDIEHREFELDKSFLGRFKWVPKYWWNYGYNKEYIFLWTLMFIVFFTIVNFFCLNYLITEVYPMSSIPVTYKSLWWQRGWYSFVFTSIIFLSLTLKMDRLNFRKRLGAIYLLIIYTIGIVCLAYIANFVIQR